MSHQITETQSPSDLSPLRAGMKLAIAMMERNMLPDRLLRIGIRRLLRERLRQEREADPERQQDRLMAYIEDLKSSPIAVHTADANEQHYELPTRFFQFIMGRHMKYSCGYWPEGARALDDSEEAMLRLTAARAEIENGHRILDLGCGWGAFSLYAAAKYPQSQVLGVSNSRTQREYIISQAAARGLRNLRIETCDMTAFQTEEKFDRIVSVEMFEHMRNYRALLDKLAGFLDPGGKLFVHIFTHKEFAYRYEIEDETDWMSKYFFTGGQMPSRDLLLFFPERFAIRNLWVVSGREYKRTCEAWLARMTAHRAEIMPILAETYGEAQALKWWVYWRVFFMACAELFGYSNGSEWFVSHYLFDRR
jgi:cyclopropane-fatty-acyl-phospholipid synthase